jgi:hypothetical protein
LPPSTFDEGMDAGHALVRKVSTVVMLFVAVVVSPTVGRRAREAAVYVCDGKRLCEWFSGSASGNRFTAGTDNGDGEATG